MRHADRLTWSSFPYSNAVLNELLLSALPHYKLCPIQFHLQHLISSLAFFSPAGSCVSLGLLVEDYSGLTLYPAAMFFIICIHVYSFVFCINVHIFWGPHWKLSWQDTGYLIKQHYSKVWRWIYQHDTSMGQRKNCESPTGIKPMTSWILGWQKIHWAYENLWRASLRSFNWVQVVCGLRPRCIILTYFKDGGFSTCPCALKVASWTWFYGYNGKLFEPENMLWENKPFLHFLKALMFRIMDYIILFRSDNKSTYFRVFK